MTPLTRREAEQFIVNRDARIALKLSQWIKDAYAVAALIPVTIPAEVVLGQLIRLQRRQRKQKREASR